MSQSGPIQFVATPAASSGLRPGATTCSLHDDRVDREQVVRHLSALRSSYWTELRFLRLDTDRPSRGALWLDAEAGRLETALDEVAARVRRGEDVYVGMNPRREKGDGTKASIPLLVRCWADLDLKNEGIDAAEAALRSCPCVPTGLVNSGRGLHPWWDLAQPVAVEAPGAIKSAEHKLWLAVQEGIFQYFHNFAPDRRVVSNEAQILRLAGTWNQKPDGGPVRLLWAGGATYSLDDLVSAFPRRGSSKMDSALPDSDFVPPGEAEIDSDELDRLVAEALERGLAARNHELLRALLDRDEEFLAEKYPPDGERKDDSPFDWSRADAALVELAFFFAGTRGGVPDELLATIADGVMRGSDLFRDDRWEQVSAGVTYGVRTLQRVFEQGDWREDHAQKRRERFPLWRRALRAIVKSYQGKTPRSMRVSNLARALGKSPKQVTRYLEAMADHDPALVKRRSARGAWDWTPDGEGLYRRELRRMGGGMTEEEVQEIRKGCRERVRDTEREKKGEDYVFTMSDVAFQSATRTRPEAAVGTSSTRPGNQLGDAALEDGPNGPAAPDHRLTRAELVEMILFFPDWLVKLTPREDFRKERLYPDRTVPEADRAPREDARRAFENDEELPHGWLSGNPPRYVYWWSEVLKTVQQHRDRYLKSLRQSIRLRARTVPRIVLRQQAEVIDRVLGLALQADDIEALLPPMSGS